MLCNSQVVEFRQGLVKKKAWNQSDDRDLSTTPRVAYCVLETKTFSCALKNALAYYNTVVVVAVN
jgi:hypothetical protein